MPDPLKKVRPHEKLRIPAAAYNAFVDASRWVQKQQTGNDTEASRTHRSAGIILVKNTSGAKRSRFHVLGLDDVVIAPDANLDAFKNQIALTGGVPNARHAGQFVILQEPLDPDSLGRAIVAGVSIVRVRVVREGDRYADIDAGQCDRLRSVASGSARILWKEPGLGIKWAVLRLGDRPRFGIFQLSGQWEAGSGCGGGSSSGTTSSSSGTSGAGEGEESTSEPLGWANMSGCKPVYFVADDCTYAASADEPAQTVWHAVGYPGAQRQQVLALHQTTQQFPARFGCGDWVWCCFNDQEQRWQVLDGYEDHWRFKLLTPLSRCGSAQAKLVLFKDGKWCPVNLTFTVHDSVGVVCPGLCDGLPTSSGTPCNCATPAIVPAGTFGMAKRFADSCRWEVLNLGEGCCDGGGGSSSGSSGSGSSGSGSSGSGSSGSGSSGPAGIPIRETDVRCESGKLNVYVRTVTIRLIGGVLTSTSSPWTFDHRAGCCCCDGCTDSSSGLSGSSSGSSGSSGSGSGSSGSGSSGSGSGSSGASSGWDSSGSSGTDSSGSGGASSGDSGSSGNDTSSGDTSGFSGSGDPSSSS